MSKTSDPEPDADSPLLPRQHDFVQEYLIDANPTKAAKRAGYAGDGSRGRQLMKEPRILAAIEHEHAERAKRVNIRPDDVVRGLRAIAEDDDAPPSARVAAWAQLGKHTGGFVDRHQVEQATVVKFVPDMGRDDDGVTEAAATVRVDDGHPTQLVTFRRES